jgi:hypothetical protein
VKASRALQQARATLLESGWCQGVGVDADGRCCVIGSFNSIKWHGYWPALGYLDQLVPTGAMSLVSWNDEAGRTVNEVLELLDCAASAAMSDEAINEA